MIILTNCLTSTPDEGCIKVATALIGRLKKAKPATEVISYGEYTGADRQVKLNKFFLNRSLAKLLREKQEPVLYIPFPSKIFSAAVRIFVLSWLAPKPVAAVLTMTEPVGKAASALLRLSGAKIVTLSRQAAQRFETVVGKNRTVYLKTGVDTEVFRPVSPRRQQELKRQWGFDPEKKLVLHVGHLKRGRNVQVLKKIDPTMQVLLVCSTRTADEADEALRQELLQSPNITLLEDYVPCVEWLYQMADCYLFPVVEQGNCIDVPLSALEAAACGTPVLTTAYGEMAELLQREGFFFLRSFECEGLSHGLCRAMESRCDPRQAALEYDWDDAVQRLTQIWEL